MNRACLYYTAKVLPSYSLPHFFAPQHITELREAYMTITWGIADPTFSIRYRQSACELDKVEMSPFRTEDFVNN
jgi:hypothetical protein